MVMDEKLEANFSVQDLNHHVVNNRYNNVLESNHGESLYKVLNCQSPTIQSPFYEDEVKNEGKVE